MKLTNYIRKWCNLSEADGIPCNELRILANLIDDEMIEFPRDRNGVVIRPGDVLYDCDDTRFYVKELCFGTQWEIRTDLGRITEPRLFTHECLDAQ